eukprot:14162691-Ditylum_brightwellii.AAC.1
MPTLKKSLQHIKQIYNQCSLKFLTILLDSEFESLRSHLAAMKINLSVQLEDEHIHSIKYLNCTIKEE